MTSCCKSMGCGIVPVPLERTVVHTADMAKPVGVLVAGAFVDVMTVIGKGLGIRSSEGRLGLVLMSVGMLVVPVGVVCIGGSRGSTCGMKGLFGELSGKWHRLPQQKQGLRVFPVAVVDGC